jgi:hypothetical protein
VIRFLLRLVRRAVVALLAFAVAAKFLLESNAREDTDEIDLVNIFGGYNLASSADPFFGGKITSVFGVTHLDLRRVVPAPTGIYLDLLVAFGGLSLVIPPGWKVVFGGLTTLAAVEVTSRPVLRPV